jgi:signal transduction histidine kinase
LIAQALISVLANAAQHGASKEPIEISVARDNSTIVFSVADHGPGLVADEENKVFEKFYRRPGTAPGGLGLGLWIARQLVETHGGQITAENRGGVGARFSIRLPIGEAMRLPAEATA